MEESKNILNFYVRNNKNKYLIAKQEKGRDISRAEHTVLSCINALALYSEIYNNINIDYVLKMIIAKDFSKEDVSNLTKKNEILYCKEDFHKGNFLESYVANTACKLTSNDLSTSNSAYPEIKKLFDNYKKLQNTIRQGHIYWGLRADRKESILEHIYGTLLLCIGLESEYKYSLDYNKMLKMLLLHETEEIVIGDKTNWDISPLRKKELGRKAVNEVLNGLHKSEELKNIIEEFENRYSVTAGYAYLCDKLEYDLQVRQYQIMGCYDFKNRPENVVTESKEVQKIINDGANSVFDVHYEYDKDKYISHPSMRKILEYSKRY